MASTTVPPPADAPRDVPPPGAAERPDVYLTHRQEVSQACEVRRRELLADKRKAWENRRSEALADQGAYTRMADAAKGRGDLAAESRLRRLAARAARCAARAHARVERLRHDLAPRVAKCEVAQRWVRCGCADGAPQPLARSCNVRLLCSRCDARRARRLRRRLVAAVAHHVEELRRARRSARVRMITLTVAHSGDLRRDRAELTAGWRTLRKQLGRWWGDPPRFALCWEHTPGRDGLGHVHAHVVVLGGPSWWSYAAIQRTWRSACPRSSGLHVATSRGGASAAARYLSKYVTKGLAELPDDAPDELRAQLLAACYQARMVSTSRGFWVPLDQLPCRYCGQLHRAAHPPSRWELGLRALRERRADEWLAAGSASVGSVEHAASLEADPPNT